MCVFSPQLSDLFLEFYKGTSYGSINPYFYPFLRSQISQSLYPFAHQSLSYSAKWHLLHKDQSFKYPNFLLVQTLLAFFPALDDRV